MKAKLALFLLFISRLSVEAQQVPALFGLHSNITNTVFSSITLSDAAFNIVSISNLSYSATINKTTFDRVGARYFIKSGNCIYIFSALSGNLIDSLTNTANLHNIEYDAGANSIVGIEKQGTKFLFKSIHVGTKIAQIKSTLETVETLVIGESSFDTQNRRYFTLTNLGLIVVDANGKIGDVLCASPNLNGIEYNPIDNKIYYLEWNGSAFDFVAIEANTCSIGLVGYYIGLVTATRGESTFNSSLGHYFCRTNFGIMELDTQTGQVVQTLAPSNFFAHMEYADLRTLGVSEASNDARLSVYPNPSSGIFHFKAGNESGLLEVMSAQGQVISTKRFSNRDFSIDLSAYEKGVYLYRLKSDAQATRQGRLVVE